MFGDGLNAHFGWAVNLSAPDIDVALLIHDSDVLIGLRLTPASRHRRNLPALGPTRSVSLVHEASGSFVSFSLTLLDALECTA